MVSLPTGSDPTKSTLGKPDMTKAYPSSVEEVNAEIYHFVADCFSKHSSESQQETTPSDPGRFFSLLAEIHAHFLQAVDLLLTPSNSLRENIQDGLSTHSVRQPELQLSNRFQHPASRSNPHAAWTPTVSKTRQSSSVGSERCRLKHLLLSVAKTLENFEAKYRNLTRKPDAAGIIQMDRMLQETLRRCNTAPLSQVTLPGTTFDLSPIQAGLAGGQTVYQQYCIWINLLAVAGQVLQIPLQNPAAQYQHWSFLQMDQVRQQLQMANAVNTHLIHSIPFSQVNWTARDVLVGVLRNRKQLDICLRHKFYHVPAEQLPNGVRGLHYVAIYQSKRLFGAEAGIRYYGEIAKISLVSRNEIREIPRNLEQSYYRLEIKSWHALEHTIRPGANGFITGFTTMFLLHHSIEVPALWLRSEMEYQLYSGLNHMCQSAAAGSLSSAHCLSVCNGRIFLKKGKFLIGKHRKLLASYTLQDFSQAPNIIVQSILSQLQNG